MIDLQFQITAGEDAEASKDEPLIVVRKVVVKHTASDDPPQGDTLPRKKKSRKRAPTPTPQDDKSLRAKSPPHKKKSRKRATTPTPQDDTSSRAKSPPRKKL